jgi:phospholipid/cholesterol/gamma-HCH transport system substrate-binding protein
MTEVNRFVVAINNENGTVRRLLEDEDLYWQIRRTVENIEQATARVRPILDDVRIFTDKIARDPRQLGVKGALSSRPSGLGLK